MQLSHMLLVFMQGGTTGNGTDSRTTATPSNSDESQQAMMRNGRREGRAHREAHGRWDMGVNILFALCG